MPGWPWHRTQLGKVPAVGAAGIEHVAVELLEVLDDFDEVELPLVELVVRVELDTLEDELLVTLTELVEEDLVELVELVLTELVELLFTELVELVFVLEVEVVGQAVGPYLP